MVDLLPGPLVYIMVTNLSHYLPPLSIFVISFSFIAVYILYINMLNIVGPMFEHCCLCCVFLSRRAFAHKNWRIVIVLQDSVKIVYLINDNNLFKQFILDSYARGALPSGAYLIRNTFTATVTVGHEY